MENRLMAALASQRNALHRRVALPFQTVETVNESAQLRQRTAGLFAAGRDSPEQSGITQVPQKEFEKLQADEFGGLLVFRPAFAY